jgi:hypothetical protein
LYCLLVKSKITAYKEMDPSTTYWRTITSMDLQEDPSPLPGDPRIDHHRRLDAANQVWQGPYWAVRTQNRIPMYVQLITVQTVTKFGVLRSTHLLYQGLADKCHQITIFLYISAIIIVKITEVISKQCRDKLRR